MIVTIVSAVCLAGGLIALGVQVDDLKRRVTDVEDEQRRGRAAAQRIADQIERDRA